MPELRETKRDIPYHGVKQIYGSSSRSGKVGLSAERASLCRAKRDRGMDTLSMEGLEMFDELGDDWTDEDGETSETAETQETTEGIDGEMQETREEEEKEEVSPTDHGPPAAETEKDADDNRIQEAWTQFFTRHADLVGQTLPDEVYQYFIDGLTPEEAYQKHQADVQAKKTLELEEKLKQLEQAQRNKGASPGALGAGKPDVKKDDFDEGWDSAFD